MEDVDVALDIRRHVFGDAARIVGDEEVHRNVGGVERLGEGQGGIAPHRMADQDDGLRVAAIVADRLIGDRPPHQIGVDARRDTGALDAIRELVHAARIDEAGDAAEQIGAAARRNVDFLGGRRRRHAGASPYRGRRRRRQVSPQGSAQAWQAAQTVHGALSLPCGGAREQRS